MLLSLQSRTWVEKQNLSIMVFNSYVLFIQKKLSFRGLRKMKPKETLSEGVANIVRSFTRPALTFFGLISWVMLFVNGFDIPGWFTFLVYGMVVWWFGDRTYFKIKGKK
jgi:hypothetical protein